ncbi:MAG: hypothetical protein H7Z43_10300 [Clostridia bacterium]|nr:hypothetical protein [Deltaproteobacteria bacterium]
MFGARKSIVLSCMVALIVCGSAAGFAVSKTLLNKDVYDTALPSPFVSNAEHGTMRELANDQRDAPDRSSAKEVTSTSPARGQYKTAAELDAEDRYIDHVAGFENHDPQGTLGQHPGARGDRGISIPVSGIAVERTERGTRQIAEGDGQLPGSTQSQQVDAESRQPQQIPYADNFLGYGAYGPFGLYGGLPVSASTSADNRAAANAYNVQQSVNGVVQAQPPQQATSPGGATLGARAPGAVGLQGATSQQPVQNPQAQNRLPAQNQQALNQQPPSAPNQPAPPPQSVPFQTVPPPAAQRGF